MSNIYKESKRTITSQITTLLTTISTRSALFRQSESTTIPATARLTNLDLVGITNAEPLIITEKIQYLVHIKGAFNFRVVLVKADGSEFPIEVNGVYMMHGSFDGTLRIETDSEEPVMISTVYA